MSLLLVKAIPASLEIRGAEVAVKTEARHLVVLILGLVVLILVVFHMVEYPRCCTLDRLVFPISHSL